MPQDEDIVELYARASAGDTEAMLKWMRLQRSGRHTRFYPDGRRGPEDDGAIAFSLSVHGEGEERRWVLSAGKQVRSIEIEPDKALAMATVILDRVGPTLVRGYPVEAVFFGGCVWVKMPETADQWQMTDHEAAAFAGTLLVVLRMEGLRQ